MHKGLEHKPQDFGLVAPDAAVSSRCHRNGGSNNCNLCLDAQEGLKPVDKESVIESSSPHSRVTQLSLTRLPR